MTCGATGKNYVGQTVRTVEERWAQHLREAGPGRFEAPLHRAIRRYGAESFSVVVLERVDDREDLNQKEVEYAELYDALVPRGYSLRAGNGMASAFSTLSIARMRVAAKTRWLAPGYRERQSAVQAEVQRRPDVRARRAKGVSRKWLDENYRGKQVAARTSVAYRAKASRLRAREWEDPDIRSRHLMGFRAAIPRRSASMRATWADPAYRARLAAAQRVAWKKRRKGLVSEAE